MKKTAFWLIPLALGITFPAAPAWAFTPTSELTDVSPDHWAYNAIKTLVDRYQVMEGFNDNTFRGAKYVTRYEQAAVLSKVMAKVEEMIASATGTAPAPVIPPSVNPEDLRTIARLQQEFRDELTILRGRVDTMDQRLSVLENRVRLHGDLALLYRAFTGTQRGLDNNRVETNLALDARLAPELTYTGRLTLFNNGMQFQRNGHLWEEAAARGEGSTRGDSGLPVYLQRSTFNWTPGNWTLSGGLMRFEDTLPVGSFIRTGFSTLPLWSEGQCGYGFVGTPPVNAGGAIFRYLESGRVAWLPGLNPTQDLLDPNSAPINRPGSAPGLTLRSDWGPVEWGLGFNSGVPGSDLTLAVADVPQSFPMIATYHRGYGLAKAGLDLGLLRATGYYHLDNGLGIGQAGNGAGANLDLGNDELGLTASYAAINRPATYGPFSGYFHEAAAGLVSSNFLGTGFGLGLGTKAGSIGNPTDGNPFGWTSTGGYLRFPLFSVLPAFTVAAQTSGAGFMSSSIGSGWSAIAEFQIASLPTFRVEYDRGKFSGDDRSLLTKEPPTDELVTVGTGIRF